MKFFGICLVFLVFSANLLWSQGGGYGATLLMNGSSPVLVAMGDAGVALPVNDATSIIYNPAHLGFNVRSNNFLISYNFNETPAGNSFKNPIPLRNFGINLGYELDSINNIPLLAGVSYIRRSASDIQFTRYNDSGRVMGDFNSSESSNEFSIGASYEYYALLSFGLTYKLINSELSEITGSRSSNTGNANALDIGILAKIPVVQDYKLADKLAADLDCSLGMALLNVGEDLIVGEKEDPLPRMNSLGYSISLGIKNINEDFQIKYLNIDWSAAASSMLVRRDINGFSYTGMFGDLNIIDNLILLNHSGYVESHHGFRFSFFETLSYSIGSNVLILNDMKTSGFEFSFKGLAKIIYYYSDDNFFRDFYNQADLTFSISQIERSHTYGEKFEKEYLGLNLNVRL